MHLVSTCKFVILSHVRIPDPCGRLSMDRLVSALLALNISETEANIISGHLARHCTSAAHQAAVAVATKESYEMHIALTRLRSCEKQRQAVMNAFFHTASQPGSSEEKAQRLRTTAQQHDGLVRMIFSQARSIVTLVNVPIRTPSTELFWKSVWELWPDGHANHVLSHWRRRASGTDPELLYMVAFDVWCLCRWLGRWTQTNLHMPSLQEHFDSSVVCAKTACELIASGLLRPSVSAIRLLLGHTVPIPPAIIPAIALEASHALRRAQHAVDQETEAVFCIQQRPRPRLDCQSIPKYLKVHVQKLQTEKGLLALTTFRALQRTYARWQVWVGILLRHKALTKHLSRLCGSHHARARFRDWAAFAKQRVEEREACTSRRVVTIPQTARHQNGKLEALTQTPVHRRRLRL